MVYQFPSYSLVCGGNISLRGDYKTISLESLPRTRRESFNDDRNRFLDLACNIIGPLELVFKLNNLLIHDATNR
jgi:hypothetical protein